MKRIILLCLAGMVLFAAACQQTPENPIVVGKNTEQMLDAAQKEEVAGDGEAVDLYARLGAPERYTAELTSKKGKLSVYADAQVLLPACELPIVRVKPVEFTLEQAKHFADVLFGSDAKYVDGDTQQPKAAYMRRMELLRTGIADWDTIGQRIFDLQYETKEEVERALSALLAKAAEAPESLPGITPEFAWSKPRVWTDAGEVETTNTYLDLWAMPDDATFSRLSISNSMEFSGYADMQYIRDCAVPADAYFNEAADVAGMLSVSEQDALALAGQTLARMGLDGFVCTAKYGELYRNSSLYEKSPVYHFIFTRQINGAVETCTNSGAVNSQYNKGWYYERMHVLVEDAGILRMEYKSPYEILDTVLEETALLPFSEIQSIFEKMVTIVNNEVDENAFWDDSGKMEYHITTVRLGLASIPEQNRDTGLLVPVWDFMGYTRARSHADREWVVRSTNELTSFLTINAIDGSIVDRAMY